MEYININVDDIPYKQTIKIADIDYIFQFRYNHINESILVDLYDYKGNLIKSNEKLNLNIQLWYIHRKDLKYPKKIIVPLSLSNKKDKVTINNLGKDVVLAVFDYDNT